MTIAIAVVWWIGVLGALVPTLVILKQALLIVGTLRRIHRLALLTEEAAQGIARHVGPAGELHGIEELLAELDRALGDAGEAIRGVAERLTSKEAAA